MDAMLTIIVAMTAGMLCGAGIIAVGVTLYLRSQPPKRPGRPQEAETYLERPSGLDEFIRKTGAHPPVVPEQRTVPPLPVDAYATFAGDIAPVQADSAPYLEGLSGVIAGQRITLKRDESLIGRSRVCDIQIHDPKVSRQHAMLRLYKGHYFIQDMESSRGTLVNSQPVQTHLLKNGDQIRLGDCVLKFNIPR